MYAILKKGQYPEIGSKTFTTGFVASAPIGAAQFTATPVSPAVGASVKKGPNSDNGTKEVGVAVGIHTIR